MHADLVPSTPTPPAPLVRACRDIITHAGVVATTLTGPVDPSVQRLDDPLEELHMTNPALAAALAPMLDAVMDLDARTGFLSPDGFPTI